MRLTIEGGKPLRGTVAISGSKNAALPAMAAALLTSEPVRLTNIPRISDVNTQAEILRSLGAEVRELPDGIEINAAGVHASEIDYALAKRLRASVLLLGPLLARFDRVRLPHPGGDVIGKRSISTHLQALQGLGATITVEGEWYAAETQKLQGAYLYLDEVSVTATENALLASVLAEGTTTIRPGAMEPHVVNLCQLLTTMGAQIEGIGTHTLVVRGVKQLGGVTHHINSDEIETGTYAVAAAITKGELTLTNTPADLDPIVYKLAAMGVGVSRSATELRVRYQGQLRPTKLQVDTWPRFPTDLQPQFTVLATQATGDTLVHEWMYENRLSYTKALVTMGAQIELIGHHQAIVHGPTALHGAVIDTPDLRSGIAYVLAALAATGGSTVNHAELIERGYERLVAKLRSVGAAIDQSGPGEES